MNATKQLYASILLALFCSNVTAKSNAIQYESSYEASLLPGSRLVAGGRDEFFITGKSEQVASMPVVIKTKEPSVAVTTQPKPVIKMAAIKQIPLKTDVTEQRINQLFALHHSIVMASQGKQVRRLTQYANLRRRVSMG